MKHNWEYKRLRDVCSKESSNLMMKSLVYVDDGYAVYGASGFLGKIASYAQENPYVGIVKDGSGVGRVNLYPAKSSLLGTMQYIIANNLVTNSYLSYSLKTLDFEKYVNGAAIPHIYFKDYKNEIIPIPPLDKQEHIVAELDAINEGITELREQIKDLDNLTQSLFYETFGDPLSNSKGWPNLEFQNVFKLRSGDSLSAKNIIVGTYPVYGGNGIIGYHHKSNLSGLNIIIGRVGALCGNVRLVKGDIFVTDNAFITDNKMSLNLIFIEKLLTTLNLRQYANAAAQPVISNTSLKKIPIILPPLDLQQHFAERVEAIEEMKRELEAQIADAQTLLDSRMDYWFND